MTIILSTSSTAIPWVAKDSRFVVGSEEKSLSALTT